MKTSVKRLTERRFQRARPASTALLGLLLLTVPASAQLTLDGSHWWPHDELGARMGTSMTTGDFDGDGREDLAIGSPDQIVVPVAEAGAVWIVLDPTSENPQMTAAFGCAHPNYNGPGWELGIAMAAGDFDNDGYDDLAYGMPGASSYAPEAGEVCIWYGGVGPVQFDYERVQSFSQNALQGVPEVGDHFGSVLAVGDLNGDGYDDLAVGVPDEDVIYGEAVMTDAGVVNVIFGGPDGLSAGGNIMLTETHVGRDPGIDGRCGAALAIGDFYEAVYPGIDDLAVGCPGDLRLGVERGSVLVFIGTPAGNFPAAVDYYVGGTKGLLGTGEAGDDYGAALAAGDFDGNGEVDLAVGIPGDSDFGPQSEAGAVMVLYRGPTQLRNDNEQVFFEGLFDLDVDDFDRFGDTLVAGDFDNDGYSDLAIGASVDDSLGFLDAGEVTILYGSPDGLRQAGHQLVDMIFFAPLGEHDYFGGALASGKLFPGEGDVLAIGVPGRNFDEGGVVLLRSRNLFSDGFESGGVSAWASSTP